MFILLEREPFPGKPFIHAISDSMDKLLPLKERLEKEEEERLGEWYTDPFYIDECGNII